MERTFNHIRQLGWDWLALWVRQVKLPLSLAISAAAVATLYNAGEYDSTVAESCLEFVWGNYQATDGWRKQGGHDFYSHLYASQAFYMAGSIDEVVENAEKI